MKKLLLLLFVGFSFGMTAQTLQSVNPNSGSSGQTLQVTVVGNGTTFSQISGTSGLHFYGQFGQFAANSYQFVSETQIIADVTVPYFAPTGLYNAFVSTVNGDYYSLQDAFTVTNTANVISGNVSIDIAGDGCDASDSHMAGIRVNIFDGTNDRFTYTNAAGDYSIYVPAGNFTVTVQPEMPYFAPTPASASINFPTQNNLTQTQNFCLAPSGTHNDVEITILPIGPARPGFNASYRLAYKNKGNQVINGAITFNFDDTVLDFISSTPAVATQTLNNLSWTYSNLLPFQTRNIDFTLNVNSPMETPPVIIGDVLSFTATVGPVAGDETPADNESNYSQIVVGSYDPNDKAVTEGPEVHIDNAGNYLHYLIRFQNSGTFLAENVVVRDMLSDNLDKSTLQITSTSHPYRSTLTEGNKLEFFFENINLPPEIQNEPGSHGFIAFKIKPVSTVVLGSVIENTAAIYFDFNWPIITNTVSTTFTLLSTKEFGINDDVVLYPNPAQDLLNVQFKSSFSTGSVKIFNQLGQLVKTTDLSKNQINAIPVGDLKTGTYFVQIATDKGTSTKKLLKY